MGSSHACCAFRLSRSFSSASSHASTASMLARRCALPHGKQTICPCLHLPSSRMEGALARLDSFPGEANQSNGDWMDALVGYEDELKEGEEGEEGEDGDERDDNGFTPEMQKIMAAQFWMLHIPPRDSAMEQDDFYCAPMEMAARCGAPVKLVKALLALEPEVLVNAISGDDSGAIALPIHEATTAGAPPDLLSAFLPDETALSKLYAETPHPPIYEGAQPFWLDTPLHAAALARHASATKLLLEKYPDHVRREGYLHYPPLHLCAKGAAGMREYKRLQPTGMSNGVYYGDEESAVETCRLLLAAYPEAAALEKGKGYNIEPRTPLHLACEYNAPPALIRELLRAYPEAARMQAAPPCLGKLPIMCVAGKHLTAELHESGVARELLDANPPTAEWSLRDLLKLGPLGEEATLARLRSNPSEASVQDPPMDVHPNHAMANRPQGYPLHQACDNAAPPSVIAELIRLCPQAVEARDRVGDFPIHLAAIAASPLTKGTYGSLYNKKPPAQSVVDNSAACVKMLLRAWQTGAVTCDDFRISHRDHGYWPMHMARDRRAPEPVLHELRAHAVRCLRQPNQKDFGSEVGQLGSPKATSAS